MTYTIDVVALEAQPALCVRIQARPETLGQKFLDWLPRIHDATLACAGAMAGMPFARYLNVSEAEFEVEIGLPTTELLCGSGNIVSCVLPPGPAAVTWHIGPYEELGNAHAALAAWAAANSRVAAGGPWEIYFADEEEDEYPERWRTKVVLPLF